MKRYDLHRLVFEQFGGGGNPPGGEGGQGGEGGGSRPRKSQVNIDPKLVTHRRFIGKPTRPEIGQDERRPVNPSDIFANLLEASEEAQSFLDLFDQWMQGDDSIGIEELRELFAALMVDNPNAGFYQTIFDGLIEARGMEPNDEGVVVLPSGQTFNLVAATILLGLTIPLSGSRNTFANFMSAVCFELGFEAAFTWLINNLANVPPEEAPNLITNYIDDTLGYLENHPELQQYFAEMLTEAYNYLRENGSLEGFEPSVLSGDTLNNLFFALTLQNAATIDSFVVQAAYFFNYRGATGVAPNTWNMALHRGTSTTIRSIFAGSNTPGFMQWLKNLPRLGLSGSGGMVGFRAFMASMGGFLVTQLLVMLAFEAGFTFGEVVVKGGVASLINSNPAIVQALIDAGILVSDGDPRTDTDITWSWDRDLFTTYLFFVADIMTRANPTVPESAKEAVRDEMYQQMLNIWISVLNGVYGAGSWLWNLIMGEDSDIDPVPGGYVGPIDQPTYSPTQPTRQP